MKNLFILLLFVLNSAVAQVVTVKQIDDTLKKYGTESAMNADFSTYFQKNTECYNNSKKINYKKGVAKSAMNLEMVYETQQDFSKALELSNEGYKIAKELKDTSLMAEALLEFGNIYWATNDNESAKKYYSEAAKLGYGLKDDVVIGQAFHGLGMIYIMKNSFDTSLTYFKQSERHFSKSSEKEKRIGSNIQIGVVYFSFKKNLDSAFYFYEKAKDLSLQNNDKMFAGLSYMFMSDVERKKGNFDVAEVYLNQSMVLIEPFKDKSKIHDVYYRMAKIKLSKKEYKEAYESLLMSYKIKDSLYSENKIKEITTLKLSSEFEKEKEIIELKKKQEQEILNQKIDKEKSIKNWFVACAVLFLILSVFIFRSFKNQQKANVIISRQKEKIENQHKEITDSIKYAQGIQQSILPVIDQDSIFVSYKPKDIVSGDFYWFKDCGDRVFIAVADCTGHGVPGALMSMINHDLLEEAVVQHNDPGSILSFVNNKLSKKMSTMGRQDGMDIALLCIHKMSQRVFYAGAKRNLYVVSNCEVSEIAGDKSSIGGDTNVDYEFSTKTVNIKQGDMVYMTTDGFVDQFGGDNNKKFGTKKFKEFISKTSELPLSEQKVYFNDRFEIWKGDNEQTDDVCVIGVRM